MYIVLKIVRFSLSHSWTQFVHLFRTCIFIYLCVCECHVSHYLTHLPGNTFDEKMNEGKKWRVSYMRIEERLAS